MQVSKKITQVSSIALLLFLAISCKSKKEDLAKTWFFTMENRISTDSRKDPVLTPANFIHLENDGRYSSYLLQFETGNWILNNGMIELQADNKVIHKLRIINSNEKELGLDIEPGNNDDCQMLFTGINNPFKDVRQNPFNGANNQWRISPNKKEDETAIRQRIKNYFHYWELYFTWALAAKIDYLDVRSLKGPVKIYGNGFALVPFEELNQEWHTHFYDLENSRQAYDMIETMLKKETVSWPKTDNKFKAFISAFQQVQHFLDKP